jgi:RecB family endonuclease NucS
MLPGTLLLADCTVHYEGRAKSTLKRGQYLVIYKADGSLAIHGLNKIKPLNYLSNRSKLLVEGNLYTWTRKKERITVNVFNTELSMKIELSEHEPVKTHTEKELVEKIITNWDELLGHSAGTIIKEYPTPHGPIDLYKNCNGLHVIVEAKRKTVTLKDVTQILRYKETFDDQTACYIAGPRISKNAAAYATNHDVHYLNVDFDR